VSSRWRKGLVVGAIVGLVAVGGVVWGGTARSSGAQGDSPLSLDKVDGRVEVWSRAIYGIEDFPLTGMGLNTFRHVLPVLYPLFSIGPEVDLGHAHNEFLQAALDLGLPGLIAFIALYLGAFTMVGHIWRAPIDLPTGHAPDDQPPGRRPDRAAERRTFALGLGGALLAHLVYGLTDAIALGAKPGLVFWLVLGLIAGLFEQTCSHLQNKNGTNLLLRFM
jgi:putative inorganic carbon (hco3(-)) transporter